MNLLEQIEYEFRCKTKAKDPVVEFREFNFGIPEQGMWILQCGREIYYGALIFNVYQHSVTGVYAIETPQFISRNFIVGYSGCKPCKFLKTFIPQMDYVTFDRDGILSAKAKAVIGRLVGDKKLSFPMMMATNGQAIYDIDVIEQQLGFKLPTGGM
jgi:hypothetical protein